MIHPDPITAALDDELQHELCDRGIVVWLDRDGNYTRQRSQEPIRTLVAEDGSAALLFSCFCS